MTFYGERFRRDDEEDIWEELKRMLMKNLQKETSLNFADVAESSSQLGFDDLESTQALNTKPIMSSNNSLAGWGNIASTGMELFNKKKGLPSKEEKIDESIAPIHENEARKYIVDPTQKHAFEEKVYNPHEHEKANNASEPYLAYEDLLPKESDKERIAREKRELDAFNKAWDKADGVVDDEEKGVLTGKAADISLLDKVNELKGNISNNIFKDSNKELQNNDSKRDLTWQEKAFDKLLKDENILRKAYPVSADMYVDARTDFSRARTDKNATVLENMNSLDSKTQEALKKYGVKPNERGVYYNADSDVSKKFGKSSELKRAFDKNYQNIKDGNFKSNDLNFDATIFDAIANKDKFDRHSSIQHAKLHKAYIDKKGKKHAEILDKLDYVKRPDSTIKDKIKNYPNNHGYSLQEKGALENYFTVMDVIIEDDDWLDKLRRKLGL